MKPILARAQRATLARFARGRLLVAFDYDGTLAPIVDDPARAAMRASTRARLRRVAALYPCVVISGRSRRDLLGRLRGLGVIQAIGSHGGEPSARARQVRARVRRWHESLARRLRGLAGVTIEDKGLSLAVHYRRAPDQDRAREVIRAAASRLARARVVGGKCVVNVVARAAPHKGTALAAERRRLRCDTTLYVGDDETDEDAFSLPGRSQLGIRVGLMPGSRARYYLRGQRQVDSLLETLIRLRASGPRRRLSAARAGRAPAARRAARPQRRRARSASG
jgi:trehalose 6-phosphate phosphatase